MRIKYAKPLKRFRLSRLPDKRYHLVRTMVTQLMEHERITTTSAKAKHIRSTVEALITLGRRYVYQKNLRYKGTFDKMLLTKRARNNFFDNIIPRFADRKGSCTRVKYMHDRNNDRAPVSYLELLGK